MTWKALCAIQPTSSPKPTRATPPFHATQFGVGHYRGVSRLLREQERRFAERRVVLCGDYLVGPHAEGAVSAGERAACALLGRLADQTLVEATRSA